MVELFDKHGGFRRLHSFTLATIIQIETLRFCRRFLTHETREAGAKFHDDDMVHESAKHALAQRKKYARWLDADDAVVVANAMLITIGDPALQAAGGGVIRAATSGGSIPSRPGGSRDMADGVCRPGFEEGSAISVRDREAFERQEREYRRYQGGPGIRSKPVDPPRVRDAR